MSSDADRDIYHAAVHEVGHSLCQYVLSGAFGGIEVKASEPGNGRCWVKWPDGWRDEGVKFWLFTGLVDAAGIEAEWLLCQTADARYSAAKTLSTSKRTKSAASSGDRAPLPSA